MSTSAFADDAPASAQPFIEVVTPTAVEAKKPTTITLQIFDGKTKNNIRAEELVRLHDAPFYVIITDETFSDYHYLPASNDFTVSFTPKHSGAHYLWADVTTLQSSTPMLLSATIGKASAIKFDSAEFLESAAGDYRFRLKLDKKPSVNRPVTGVISISRTDGQSLAASDAIIGEGTHVAGLYTDMRNAILMRSTMLEHPKKAKANIPAVAFYFTPVREGNMRVFATFTLNGQLVHVPFGITVLPERNGINFDMEIPDMPEIHDIEMPDIELPSFDNFKWERILP